MTTEEKSDEISPLEIAKRDWKILLNRLSYKGLVKNVRFFIFLAVLCVLYIANSQHAVSIQRQITAQQKIEKDLRYQYNNIKNRMAGLGLETDIIRRAGAIGLKPLTSPPYELQPWK